MSHPVMKPTRIASAVLFVVTQAVAAPDTVLEKVVVTATRFEEPAIKTASNVSIITADDIRNSPAASLPDLLKTIAGIDVRPQYGNTGLDATVDIRGFGPTASSNTLILLDGQRLNPVDSATVSWSTIPLSSIERIEILPGSGTVLFGDQASGGVINIVTDKSLGRRAMITATAGSSNTRGLDGSLSVRGDQSYVKLFAHDLHTDGWRRNNQTDQQSISGRVGLILEAGEVFADFGSYRDANGAPGNLWSASYLADPRQAKNPQDRIQRDGFRIRPGLAMTISPTVKFEMEIAATEDNASSDTIRATSSSFNHRGKSLNSLTPRLRWQHGLGQLESETVFGVDYYDAKVDAKTTGTHYLSANVQRISQQSKAIYAQNTTGLGNGWSANLGMRSQTVKQQARQFAYSDDFFGFPNNNPAVAGDSDRTQSAVELGLAYQTQAWRTYAKAGTTFRFPNADELFGFDPFTFVQFFAGNLRPQHGRINELGTRYAAGKLTARATLYRLNLSDEIGYDDGASLNVNFPKTRRQGIETEIGWKWSDTIQTKLTYAYLDATFSEGPYAGNQIPMTAKHALALQLGWTGGTMGNYSAVLKRTGDRRYGGDFTNSQGYLSGYTTLDLQAGWDLQPWQITAKLNNAFDRRYAAYGAYASWQFPTPDFYYAPADGRSFTISARYAFH